MSISRRELGYLVSKALTEASDEVLVAVAELVLSKKVTRRAERYVLSAAASPQAFGETKSDPSSRRARERTGGTVSAAGMRVLQAFRAEGDGDSSPLLDGNDIRIRSKVRKVNLGRVIEALVRRGYLRSTTDNSRRLYRLTLEGAAAIGPEGEVKR